MMLCSSSQNPERSSLRFRWQWQCPKTDHRLLISIHYPGPHIQLVINAAAPIQTGSWLEWLLSVEMPKNISVINSAEEERIISQLLSMYFQLGRRVTRKPQSSNTPDLLVAMTQNKKVLCPKMITARKIQIVAQRLISLCNRLQSIRFLAGELLPQWLFRRHQYPK